MYCALGTQAWVRKKTDLEGEGLMMGYLSPIPTFAHQALSEARGRGVGDFLQVPKAHPALLGGGVSQRRPDAGAVSEVNWSGLGSCRKVE